MLETGIDNPVTFCYSLNRTDKTRSVPQKEFSGGIVYEHFQIHTEIHGSRGTVPEAGILIRQPGD